MSLSKNHRIATLAAAVILAASAIAALAVRVSAQSSPQDEVLAAQKKFTDACVAADAATLNSVMADDALFIHGNGVMQSKAEFVDAITTGKLGVSQYDLHDPKVVEFNGGAIVTGLVDFGIKPPAGSTNPPMVLHFRGSAVWLHSAAGWRLLFDQDTTLAAPRQAPPAH
ncbi:MAG TPA: nuclear transport factor 2 family protein [Candidatus Acidoferrales bacterium]|jgi:ketosteroid isomerase-like protein|nr:nuclear transport factor 2 family protein [Candidatus Acidoferrales bacterium]